MKTVHALKVTAMLPLVFMTLILLMFGIGEIIGGDISGIQHFAPIIFVGLVAWLGWKRPLWGGILFFAGALLEAGLFWHFFAEREFVEVIAPLVIMVLPLTFSGILLLMAHWLGHTHRTA